MKRLPMYNDLYTDCIAQLKKTEQESDPLKRYALGVVICNRSLDQVYQHVTGTFFTGDDTEMQFFKEVKPLFESKLICCKKLYWLHNYPASGGEHQFQKRLKRLRKRIRKFYRRYRDFCTYIRENQTCSDRQYFLRHHFDWRQYHPLNTGWQVAGFNTNYDHVLAQLLAYEELEKLFQEWESARVMDMEQEQLPGHEKLIWTAGVSAFIELVYALFEVGAFNRGRATLKQIAAGLGQFFSCKPGNIYRMFVQLCARKTERTRFLSTLVARLNKRMDDADL